MMSSGRILVADDEPSVRESVGYALAQDGFDVDVARDGNEATEKVSGETVPFDLLILDIMMPGMSGLDICREVRSRSAVPIIVLTATDAEVDKVVGLEVGADDYVTKPFSVRELLGRVRAQLRRRELDRGPLNQAVRIEAGPVAIDLVRHVAMVRDVPINLTRSEFQLLRQFAAPWVIDIDDGPVKLLRNQGFEQSSLGVEIGIHVFMKIEMILRQVGEHPDTEIDTVHPVHGDGMGRNLHDRPAAAVAAVRQAWAPDRPRVVFTGRRVYA